MSKIDVESLKSALEAIVSSIGFELAEISAPVVGGRLTLRLFIHSPKGVTLEGCAAISRAVSDKLDTDDLIAKRYTLEVSSLGLDRPLLTAGDFLRRIGEKVKIFYEDNGNKINVKGILKSVDDQNIKIQKEEKTINVPVESNPRGKIII